MRIALAQVPHPASFEAGLDAVLRGIGQAAAAGARLVCFPECCLKGMRGTDFPVEALTRQEHDAALDAVRERAAGHRIHVVLPTERPWQEAWQNGAYVVSADGALSGYQTKNQIPVEEEPFFVPGSGRRLFEIEGVVVGIAICHEGWRYPETVRWAARRGAQVVLHPHFCGGPGKQSSDEARWGDSFYEKAMACRAAENGIYFASVNFALPVQDSATTLLSPEGECLAYLPRSEAGLLTADLDMAPATAFLAHRFAPDRFAEE